MSLALKELPEISFWMGHLNTCHLLGHCWFFCSFFSRRQTHVWDVKGCFHWCWSLKNCHDYNQKTYPTNPRNTLCSCEKTCGFGPAQENLSWRNLCIGEVKSIYFLNNLSGHSVTCNLRSHFLRWLWNAPDAQCDGLDKAAEGEMQKVVPLIGTDTKSPWNGQLAGRASLWCFHFSIPVKKRLIPVESYLRTNLWSQVNYPLQILVG